MSPRIKKKENTHDSIKKKYIAITGATETRNMSQQFKKKHK